jgi:tetratricopeptide (TPR) repeat protein
MAEWWEIKLNPKKLNKMLKEELSRIEEDEQYGLMYDFRLIAAGRYYMYLGNFDEGKKYILKAIEAKKKRIEEAISKLGYENDAIAMNKTRLAKMYRWIGDIEKLKQECFEAVKIFRKVYEEAKKMNDSLARNPEVCSYFYVLWADAEYYLGNYQMAVDVKKVFAKNTTGIVSSALAEYILKNDAQALKNQIKILVEGIIEFRCEPDYDTNVYDPWHWYEEAKKIAGLPGIFSIFDPSPPILPVC